MVVAADAHAQSTDIQAIERQTIYPQQPSLPQRPDVSPAQARPVQESVQVMPAEAGQVKFVLRQITLNGMSAYRVTELQRLWASLLGKEITLADIYGVAATLTQRYQADGYFLSRAFVPAQAIDDGVVQIDVVEGYIGQVDHSAVAYASGVLDKTYARLKTYKPIKIDQLERELLLLEDLSGASFQGVLAPLEASGNGVLLSIVSAETDPASFSVRVDNSGSKFVGPNMGSATAQFELPSLGFSQTTVNYATSLPTDELKYATIQHRVPIWRTDVYLSMQGSYSHGEPGYTLAPNEIKTTSKFLAAEVEWKAIRQRRHNLDISAGVDWRNSRTNILGQPLTRDYIRSAHLTGQYEFQDNWHGANMLDLSVQQGLDILDASQAGDMDLSRALGRPDFTLFSGTFYRFHALAPDWTLLTGLTGQYSDDPLLSAQEFGYGGQSFGRPYDYSEIVGDKGFAGMAEVRYDGLKVVPDLALQPFAYYDFGKVWNYDPGQPKAESGASIGSGVRMSYKDALEGGLTVAQPLTRAKDTPAYGNAKSPRFLFSLNTKF